MTGVAGRVRLVAQSPDGAIYIANDAGDLFRLRRVKKPAPVAGSR